MTEEKYRRIFGYLENHKSLKELVLFVNNWVTLITYIAYPLMLVRLFVDGDERIIITVAVPAVSFIIVSVVRYITKAPRPYEKYDFVPLIQKNSTCNSFPSRHVFSVFVIAMAFMNIQLSLGILFIAFGIALAVCRVAIGVHFPKDVAAGAVAGIIAGTLFFI